MADKVFEKTMEVLKQRHSGFTPAVRKDYEDRMNKCSAAVYSILNGSNKGLSPLEIQDAINDDSNLGLILFFTLEKMEAEGTIEPVAASQVTQPFPYSQNTYRLKP